MRVFISWSGPTSRQVAAALRDWMKKVIQSVEPWMSDKDIESGARWSDAVAANLKDVRVGIICLTAENKAAPWLHFEAGAISKTLEDAFVCPYLFKLDPTDIVGPLTQFQARRDDKDGTKRLLQTINGHPDLKEPLNDADLEESFELWWSRLEPKLAGISVSGQPQQTQRPTTEMIAETLELVRGLARGGLHPGHINTLSDFAPYVSDPVLWSLVKVLESTMMDHGLRPMGVDGAMETVRFLLSNQKISAIKTLRQYAAAGLKQAKDLVEDPKIEAAIERTRAMPGDVGTVTGGGTKTADA